ncbi:putative Histidine kinase [Mesorhizobium escarrei]|uniref:histidine kinase n=1 Tax=Mesorhizobium escarrei TaxID=666018 RepID=A0ABN8JKJ9_9HYPH|nr:putative Histidine kinase [Mesorhizobium escarrei]
MTTINALTSSIAHEVNQPLGAIVTNAHVALRWLARQPPNLEEAREALEQIGKDGHRASEVIGRVRALLKKTATTRERVDLTEQIQDTVALVHGEVLRHRILVRTELAPELPPVAGDRVQVQQVLLNLVMNGIEAMKEVTERPRELWIHRTDESGAVRVAVQDAGVGLDPNSVDRLFETFYTTKPEGMGLAICRSIIEAHGGRLWASANEPRGAVFEFCLPPEKDENAPAATARPMLVL